MRRYTRETGIQAIALALNPLLGFQVSEVRVHLDAVGGDQDDLVISLDSVVDPVYDIIFATQSMAAITDYVWQPTRPRDFVTGDIFKVDWPNSQGKTYGVEVVWSWVA
jgi:hypothetical protein